MLYKRITTLVLLTGLILGPYLAQAESNVFNVDSSYDKVGRSSVSAGLQHTSEKAYFFVEDTYYSSLSTQERSELLGNLGSLANEFDSKIYPTLRANYGSEYTPGIDNDTRITILVTQLTPNTGGYVLFDNQKPKSENTRSNEREMIYLNSSIVSSGNAKAHLAHEFVHLIEYNQRMRQRGISDPRWLSEALADYAPTLLGYNNPYAGSHLDSRVEDFLTFPYDSLTGWSNRSVDLATSSLFMHYLVAHYGNGVLLNIMQSESRGELAVTEALSRLNYSDVFSDIFTNWTVANYLNSATKDGSTKYSYNSPFLSYGNLHISTPVQYSLFPGSSISSNFFANHGAANWLKFVPGQLGQNNSNTLSIKFNSAGSGGQFKAPYVITDILGQSEVKYINLINGQGEAVVGGFGTNVLSVVLVPSNYYQTNNNNPVASTFTINVALNDGSVKGDTNYPEGSLLRARGDKKVYVIKNGTKRWIPTAEIFTGYGHLKWENIIDVDPSVLAQYQESRLIKFIGDYKVYEVNANGNIKQHLNITPTQFDASGRLWNAIYEVNQNEYNAYTTGSPITF